MIKEYGDDVENQRFLDCFENTWIGTVCAVEFPVKCLFSSRNMEVQLWKTKDVPRTNNSVESYYSCLS